MFNYTARLATIAPRGARFVSTAIRTPAPTAVPSSTKANITTNAASIAEPAPAASEHVRESGRLKSAHRHFHANATESASGLNESQLALERQNAKLNRMRDAKEMAGLV